MERNKLEEPMLNEHRQAAKKEKEKEEEEALLN